MAYSDVHLCFVPHRQLERGLTAAARLGNCSMWLYGADGRLLATSAGSSAADTPAGGAIVSASVTAGGTVVGEVRATASVPQPHGPCEATPDRTLAAAELAAAWMGDLWGASFEGESLAAEIVHSYDELHLLYELGESLTSRLNVADAADFVLHKIVTALCASRAELYLSEGGDERAYAAADADDAAAAADDAGGGSVGGNVGNSDGHSTADYTLTTVLRSGGHVVGRITVGRRPSAAPFSSTDSKLLDAVGTLAANAIRNGQLHDQSRRTAEALRESEAYLRAIMDNVADGIVTLDEAGVIRSFNPAAERVFGYSAREVVGEPFRKLLPDTPSAATDIRSGGSTAFATGGVPGIDRREAVGRRKDGALFSMDMTLGEMRLDASCVTIVSVRDITERKHAERLLEHQALHDSLTGLPNRALLQDRLSHAVRAARRDDALLALMVMDLDRFKDVNDTFGHHFGDVLLRQVGTRITDAVRPGDTVARLGGDEFAVVLPNADAATVVGAAERLLRALERPFLLEGNVIEVGASIGIALYPEHGTDGDTLLRRADVAMYIAKKHNTGRALYASEHDLHSPERLGLVGELRRAIERGELVLHYQPKADLRSGRVQWVEALVRWDHPTRGRLFPDEFIPLAEQTGLIRPLTAWVLDQSLIQSSAWLKDGLKLGVAVNLSARNLHDAELPGQVGELLHKHNFPPSLLKVEITESSLVVDPERAMHILSRLRARGVQVAIDDFGVGYSSLAYLKKLPVTQLKIDRSFIQQMLVNRHDAAIVRSTIGLSHELGLQVVAEGVEDEATWDLLAGLGCDLVQGNLISRPLPPPELAEWLTGRARSTWTVQASPVRGRLMAAVPA